VFVWICHLCVIVSFDQFIPMLLAFIIWGLVSSLLLRQETGCEECIRNDLWCVAWDVIGKFNRSVKLHVTRNVLCLPVCTVYVCWTRGWAVQKWVDRSRCRLGGWLMWKHILDGGRYPTGRGNIRGCPKHWKTLWVTVACTVQKGSFNPQ